MALLATLRSVLGDYSGRVRDGGVDDDLVVIDGALLRIRRLWTSSVFTDRLRAAVPADVELSTVFVVEAVGRDGEETTVGRLAELLGVEASTASRLAAGAQAAGFIDRRPSPTDSRRAAVTLTATGEALFAVARGFRFDLLRELTADWSNADRSTFGTLMARFAGAVTDARADLPIGPSPRPS